MLEEVQKIDPDGLLGGYSIAFDLVSQEYGWSDDQILDLSVRRLRQIVAAINRRKYLQRREDISLTSWQTRQLATYVAGGYMIDGKTGNPALDAAMQIAFDDIEAEQLKEAEARSRNGGNLVWGTDESGREVVTEVIPDLTNVRSSEAVMNAFGDPSKWRTR